MDRTTVARRTVLRSIGAVGLGLGAVGSAGASRTPDEQATAVCDDRPPVPTAVANRPGAYVATVDRVVDGAHVVILLEEDGRTVDQLVLPAAEYPCLAERDRLLVVLDDREPIWIRRLREP
ncbi:hypothetical protein OB905_11045 [Halobacteria archaeon AArc-dxtr1]|nr:hypothetical protein [Halobacteria archaeon AArc-dxtr1]